MMTDEQMDERLQLMGAQWRAENVAAAAADLDGFADEIDIVATQPRVAAGHRFRRFRLVAAGIGLAAVVIAVVAIAVGVRPSSSGPIAAPASRSTPVSTGVAPALTGQVWELVYVDGTDASVPQQALQIDQSGAVTVDYRCTQWHGSGTFVAPSILPVGTGRISQGPNWEHSCPAPFAGESVPTVSQASINSILAGPIRWSVSNSAQPFTLTITKSDNSGRSLVYYAYDDSPAASAELVGIWHLIDANGVPAMNGQTLNFLTGTTISVSYGCGSWLGVAQTPAGSASSNSYLNPALAFAKRQVLEPRCPSPYSSANAIAVRNAVDSLLPGTVGFDVIGNTLTLTRKGAGTLTFRR